MPVAAPTSPEEAQPVEFTERARTVLQRAKAVAADRGTVLLDTEHILLALVQEGEGPAMRVLQALGGPQAAWVEVVSQHVPRRTGRPRRVQTAATADLAVRCAIREAQRHGPGFVGTEHLLLGLLMVRDGHAAGILEAAGVDLERAREVIRGHSTPLAPGMAPLPFGSAQPVGAEPPRLGIGYDVHATDESRPLILGGIEVASSFGLAGHSDADVLTHAIMDALLGAAAAGDIGTHFPDTDPEYEGASSIGLLRAVVAHIRELGYAVWNVDTVIVAERPKLASYIDAMRAALAEALSVPIGNVSVKATTTEGLGYEGQSQGIAAQAVATIRRA